MSKEIKRKNFMHSRESRISRRIREVVFGVEDGIVSTVGAVTGIAVAVGDPFTIIVSGIVIVVVESISMGVGAYLSVKSVREVGDRKIHEERLEIKYSTEREKDELEKFFCRDGWPEDFSKEMVCIASENKELMLKEMSYRELFIFPEEIGSGISEGLAMFFSYVVGGGISLLAYFLFPVPQAIIFSIIFALTGLFILGVVVSRFTKLKWWKSGGRMFLLGTLSVSVGYLIGQIVTLF